MSALIASFISPFFLLQMRGGKVSSNKLCWRISEGYSLCGMSLGWDAEDDFAAQSSWSNSKNMRVMKGSFFRFDDQVPLLEWSGYGRFPTAVVECAQVEGRMLSVQKTLNMEIVHTLGKNDEIWLLAIISSGASDLAEQLVCFQGDDDLDLTWLASHTSLK